MHNKAAHCCYYPWPTGPLPAGPIPSVVIFIVIYRFIASDMSVLKWSTDDYEPKTAIPSTE